MDTTSAAWFAKLREYVLSNASAIRKAKVARLSTYLNRGKRAHDKERRDLANFLEKHQSAFTQEQRAEFEAIEAAVCDSELGISAGSVSARSSAAPGASTNDSKFDVLSQYISAHAGEIKEAHKQSLHAFFFSKRGKAGEVNMFRDVPDKQKCSLTHEQKQQIELWEMELCCSSADQKRYLLSSKHASDEIALNREQLAAMPDIARFWNSSHSIRLSGGHVFMKSVQKEYVTATADGEKYFECSRAKNIFKKMDAGDLLLLVQTKSQQRVVAFGEVAHPAVSREVNRAMLYDRLPHHLHDALNTYLDLAAAFDYIEFNKIYDLRDCNLKAKDLLEYGGFSMDPRTNFGMGVLEALETTESSRDKLRDFLDTKTIRWPTSRVDDVDIY